MKIGFGTYRINHENEAHLDALKAAIEMGINIFEVSSHYSDGEIEKKLSKIINNETRLIIKAGYVQSLKNEHLDELKTRSEKEIKSVMINETNRYCIDPIYLDQEIDFACKHLEVSSIDTFHLHNPENLFLDPTINVYDEISKAFKYLEGNIKIGRLQSYGISSNTFIDPKNDKGVINLEQILEMSKSFKGFKSIQFPMNLVELGALEKQFSGKTLIEYAKENHLEVIINRPLNAFTEKGLLRLAEYGTSVNTEFDADKIFEEKTKSLKAKFEENREDELDFLSDVALFNQIKGFWHKQISQDAVDQVFFKHLFPFVANIWGRSLEAAESQDFYDLYEIASNQALNNMDLRAKSFKKQAIVSGILEDESKTLQHLAVLKYREYGVDLCLMGIRSRDYVKQMSSI